MRADHSTAPDFLRRGTAMVIVLGILSILALIGLALIARTHGEARRVTIQTSASSEKSAMDGVVATIQDTLRRDIWGDPPLDDQDFEIPLSNDAPPGSNPVVIAGIVQQLGNPLSLRENNEPYDAPGEADIWLGSNMPYAVDPAFLPAGTEPLVLAWDHTSYIGTDINQPKLVTRIIGGLPQTKNVNPYMWAANSRNPADPQIVRYDATALNDVAIIQTPVAIGDMIPGSNTNITIRNGRADWIAELPALQAKLADPSNAQLALDLVPAYPYFDTNSDGKPDLYDADGDGVPDSPLSLVIETDQEDANQPRRLYAAVRIVDHAGMVNVNTASSLRRTDGTLTYDELRPGLQRRGRSATDFMLDGVVHRDDWFTNDRVAPLVDRRSNGNDPDTFSAEFVRRTLLGGLPDFTTFYLPYDLRDEASLRHRNMLVPFDRSKDRLAVANDYRTLDRALRGSMLWSREIGDVDTGTYGGDPRWARLNANYEPIGFTNRYEGYTNSGGAGWRQLLDEDELYAVRKPLLTTISSEVAPPPDIGLRVIPSNGDSPIDRRLRQLWSLGMDWPVLMRDGSAIATDPLRPDSSAIASLIDEYKLPASAAMPPDWARVQPIDLNMRSLSNPAAAKADFIRYCAAAMNLALEAGAGSASFNYQGMPLLDTQSPGASLNRQYLAWQFAVNLADYRDSDSIPTYWPWQPTASEPLRYIFGVDKQPFFTEAYAYLVAGDTAGNTGPVGTNPPPGTGATPDQWFFAFELFVPPGWKIPTQNLYFRAPELGPDLIPLISFVSPAGGAFPAELDGGPADVDAVTDTDHGNFYVFTNSLTEAPSDVQAKLLPFPRTYFLNGFSIETSGRGRLELVYSPTGVATPPAGALPNHVLDVIGPQYSGGELADNTIPGTGVVMPGTTDDFSWAKRPPLTAMASGGVRAFSLRRSTKGWRFTTAWQLYSFAPGGMMMANMAPFDESLGAPNAQMSEPGADLDAKIPESVWPALTSMGGVPAGDDFDSTAPFAAFDSVADLSRMLMVGPVNLSVAPLRPILFDYSLPSGTLRTGRDLPATVLIADALTVPPSGNAPFGDSSSRVAAGRVDFVDAYRVGSPAQPWTWRLFKYFTTESLLHDGIDNDGDGAIDVENDPTEAVDVLFRTAGRININTAPASVLRAGPYMSLLPTSPTIAYYDAAPIADPLASFSANPGAFWDMASAIVAKRENRRVWVRMPQAGTGVPSVMATAERSVLGGVGGPIGSTGSTGATSTRREPFVSLASLAGLTDMHDATGGRDDLFRINRFQGVGLGGLGLSNHIIPERDPAVSGSTNTHPRLGLLGSGYSPDFRYRPVQNLADFVPIETPGLFLGDVTKVRSDPADGGGIRGRDVLLSRLSNIYSTRSDVFTAYIVLIDEDGHYVHRAELTFDRSVCFRETPPVGGPRLPILPMILQRTDGSYTDDTK